MLGFRQAEIEAREHLEDLAWQLPPTDAVASIRETLEAYDQISGRTIERQPSNSLLVLPVKARALHMYRDQVQPPSSSAGDLALQLDATALEHALEHLPAELHDAIVQALADVWQRCQGGPDLSA